jgi:hypothetical protein
VTREEAIKQADELVKRLDPVTNDRGYRRDGAAPLMERVDAILRVAGWLLAPDPAPAQPEEATQ